MNRRIICAANKSFCGEFVVLGIRHYDRLMHTTMALFSEDIKWIGGEQGFIDNTGSFLNREEAYTVADEAGQIVRSCSRDTSKLFSENLY